MRKSTHSPEYSLLCAALVRIRAAAGLSQRQLALALRVPHSWVAKIESGERRIDLIEFGWFCDACGRDSAEAAREFFLSLATSNQQGELGGRKRLRRIKRVREGAK